ncbi:N-acetylmuramoyl-L-alanine amidase [Paenibacillus flagellatus]|uniref:N-acetylmuramoyl-L-alanine amidase n=1 Tax=Paenibacillus flagellatus TaxID=2211139 RepID=A0A2V5JZ19_9BACL|nr:N-acetylmuramoyl-L-alanine amidase [Paenibacillus flagellatus]PYI52179.1 N-acetylmuramoyl-L-alanine amidase [Paenibacillus flagellatus]
MKRTVRKAILAGGVALGALLAAAGQADAETYTARVAADTLNVRAEPAGRARIVGTLGKGASVTVSEESFGWAKVQTGGRTGWVAAHYLVKTDVKPEPKGGAKVASAAAGGASAKTRDGVVTADKLWLRESPGTEGEAKRLLTKGTKLSISDDRNGWMRVRTADGETGWVSGRYVDASGRAAAAETKRAGGGLRGKLIVVDPGHGGSDPGVIGTTHGTEEKKINLSTANYVAEELRRAGAQVAMTRTGDKEQPELSDRAEASNKRRADAFVSIHYNASPKKVSGTLVYFYSEAKDRALAHSIEERLAKDGVLKSNGISFGDYHVLRENDRPSVLLELGFLTDSRDESIVRKDDYQRKAAAAIAAGLADYFAD